MGDDFLDRVILISLKHPLPKVESVGCQQPRVLRDSEVKCRCPRGDRRGVFGHQIRGFIGKVEQLPILQFGALSAIFEDFAEIRFARIEGHGMFHPVGIGTSWMLEQILQDGRRHLFGERRSRSFLVSLKKTYEVFVYQ